MNANATVQVGQFTQACSKDIVLVDRFIENASIWLEGDDSTPVVRVPNLLHGVQGLTNGVLLLVFLAIAVNVHVQMGRQSVHTGYTHTVQTARNLVGILVKLTPCVQDGHDHFEGRTVFLRVHGHGDAATVVLNGDRIAFVDGYFYGCGMAGKRFVNGVVHNFIDQVVQTFLTHIADVHRGAFTNGFESFQDLDTIRAVLLGFTHVLTGN